MTDRAEKLNQCLVEFFNKFASWETSVIKDSNLTLSETHAIEALGNDELPMKELAKRLGITTGTLTVTVDRLQDKGYAVRETSPEDRRVFLVKLTEKGQLIHRQHHRLHLQLAEELLSLLTPQEEDLFLNILEKLNKEAF